MFFQYLLSELEADLYSFFKFACSKRSIYFQNTNFEFFNILDYELLCKMKTVLLFS